MSSIQVRRILHCDMDCFYAAVHMRDDPSMQGKPVVIGGDPAGRGVVAAASYEARAYGVRSAMPASRARSLCPHALFLKPEFSRYREESARIVEILRRFTPVVQVVSIDEAYLDVSDHLGSWGSATGVAREIRRLVRADRRLTVSVGVAPNRLVAKIASDANKPDGLTVVPPARVQSFLDPLPVRRLPGVGPATEGRLGALGVHTVLQLRRLGEAELLSRFGKYGRSLHRYCRGIDDRPVRVRRERKSLSSERTFSADLERLEDMEEALAALSQGVALGLQRREITARTITVKVRYPDFTTVSRSRTLVVPTSDAAEIEGVARELLRRSEAGNRPVRLLGVGASNLGRDGGAQLRLFPSEGRFFADGANRGGPSRV